MVSPAKKSLPRGRLFNNNRNSATHNNNRDNTTNSRSWIKKVLCFLILIPLVCIQINSVTTLLGLIEYDLNEYTMALLPSGELSTTVKKPRPVSKRRKPLFILHVGPPKTGTTSLQERLTILRNELEEDNWYYLGKYDNSDYGEHQESWEDDSLAGLFNYCIKKVDMVYNNSKGRGRRKIPCLWDKGIALLKNHSSLGHNVILSEEVISLSYSNHMEPYTWKRLQEALSDWDVKVTVSHRNYFEWLPSSYNQMNKPNAAHFRLNRWLENNGKEVAVFPKYIKHVMNKNVYPVYPDVNKTISTFRPYFNVTVVNLHDKSFPSNFICQALEGAGKACREVQKLSKEDFVANPSIELSFDILSVGAKKKNMLDDALDRKFVRNATKMKFEEIISGNNEYSFPLVCLGDELKEQFFNKSWDIDKIVLTKESCCISSKEVYRKLYEDTVLTKRYCSVDVEKALLEPVWKDFYSTLKL